MTQLRLPEYNGLLITIPRIRRKSSHRSIKTPAQVNDVRNSGAISMNLRPRTNSSIERTTCSRCDLFPRPSRSVQTLKVLANDPNDRCSSIHLSDRELIISEPSRLDNLPEVNR